MDLFSATKLYPPTWIAITTDGCIFDICRLAYVAKGSGSIEIIPRGESPMTRRFSSLDDAVDFLQEYSGDRSPQSKDGGFLPGVNAAGRLISGTPELSA